VAPVRGRPFGNKFVNYNSIFGSHEIANRSTVMAREEEEEEEGKQEEFYSQRRGLGCEIR
jgi:hypothetical protein